jgi:hypothetical protein
MAKKTFPGTKPDKAGKSKAAKAATKEIQPNETSTRVHDLAWTGQHAVAIELATQALAAKKIKPALQMDLFDLRAESYIAQGKFDLAARLESHTKVVGKPILIDGATQTALSGGIKVEAEGPFQLKGKTVEVQVFSVPLDQKK